MPHLQVDGFGDAMCQDSPISWTGTGNGMLAVDGAEGTAWEAPCGESAKTALPIRRCSP